MKEQEHSPQEQQVLGCPFCHLTDFDTEAALNAHANEHFNEGPQGDDQPV